MSEEAKVSPRHQAFGGAAIEGEKKEGNSRTWKEWFCDLLEREKRRYMAVQAARKANFDAWIQQFVMEHYAAEFKKCQERFEKAKAALFQPDGVTPIDRHGMQTKPVRVFGFLKTDLEGVAKAIAGLSVPLSREDEAMLKGSIANLKGMLEEVEKYI